MLCALDGLVVAAVEPDAGLEWSSREQQLHCHRQIEQQQQLQQPPIERLAVWRDKLARFPLFEEAVILLENERKKGAAPIAFLAAAAQQQVAVNRSGRRR